MRPSPTSARRDRAGAGRDPRAAAPPQLKLTSRWSLRSKIIAVLLVPLVTLVVMWVLATWVTIAPGVALLDAQTSVEAVGQPVQSLVTQLQTERKLSVGEVAAATQDPGAEAAGTATAGAQAAATDPRALREQREATDAAIASLRERAGTEAAGDALSGASESRLGDLLLHLDGLATLRGEVDAGEADRAGTLRQYTQIIEAALALSRSLIHLTSEDLLREAQALMAMSEARELLSREDAVVTGAFAAGVLTTADLSEAVTLIGAQRHQFELASADLHVTDRLAYEEIAGRGPAASLTALEDRLIAEGRAGAPVPVDETAWRSAHDALAADLRTLELDAAARIIERGRPEATFIFTRIAVAGLLGLIALVVTALGSLRVGRSLLRRLAGLRQAALELSIDRLPRVVERLRQGERVDVATEAPPLPYGADELGQVGHAFNALQRTAVAAAVAEADLRRGVNEVFLNIARRSQTLLHRQLSILDGMERRAEDPAELEELFRVDHLATRMRRNAEYLVILAGAAPGRGWRQPVPLVDVLRGAVSEVEDYARVSVRPVPDVAITGRAVGDVIHLLAELIENATTFSPPTSKVVVGGEPVTNGLAIEVEDRGIGILPPILRELNERLADPPEFDPGAGAQLGLFVVARLAARHGIEVQLRKSAYGGTTAVALLPDSLLTLPGEQAALPAGTSGELVALTSASPTAPRSEPVTTAGFTPIAGQGDPLPSRRAGGPNTPSQLRGATFNSDGGRIEDAETAVIIATTGKPIGGRHARDHARDGVIGPVDDPEGLPKRVRHRNEEPAPGAGADGFGAATQADGARSPEQVRAMMSSYQAGTTRGRHSPDLDEVATDAVRTDPDPQRGESDRTDGAHVADGD